MEPFSFNDHLDWWYGLGRSWFNADGLPPYYLKYWLDRNLQFSRGSVRHLEEICILQGYQEAMLWWLGEGEVNVFFLKRMVERYGEGWMDRYYTKHMQHLDQAQKWAVLAFTKRPFSVFSLSSLRTCAIQLL